MAPRVQEWQLAFQPCTCGRASRREINSVTLRGSQDAALGSKVKTNTQMPSTKQPCYGSIPNSRSTNCPGKGSRLCATETLPTPVTNQCHCLQLCLLPAWSPRDKHLLKYRVWQPSGSSGVAGKSDQMRHVLWDSDSLTFANMVLLVKHARIVDRRLLSATPVPDPHYDSNTLEAETETATTAGRASRSNAMREVRVANLMGLQSRFVLRVPDHR